MPHWYIPTPSPYTPHDANWHQPMHLHLAPMWRELSRALGNLSGRVLDVGCGAKPYRQLLGAAVTEYVGFDQEGNTTADCHGDAHTLPFPNASFDATVSFQVLEHVEKPVEVLREMARVVRPGGTVLFTVPGVWPDHEVPRDFWRFTRYGLAWSTREVGLTGTVITPLGGFWSALGQMANLELDRWSLCRVLIPLVNLAARRADASSRQSLTLNFLVQAERPA